MHFLQVVIRNAKELYEFAESTMKDPAPSRYQSESVKVKRRIFFYDSDILRNRKDPYFKKVRGNRSIHAVVSTDGGCSISTRCLSCYCDAYLDFQYDQCENSLYIDNWEEQELERGPSTICCYSRGRFWRVRRDKAAGNEGCNCCNCF